MKSNKTGPSRSGVISYVVFRPPSTAASRVWAGCFASRRLHHFKNRRVIEIPLGADAREVILFGVCPDGCGPRPSMVGLMTKPPEPELALAIFYLFLPNSQYSKNIRSGIPDPYANISSTETTYISIFRAFVVPLYHRCIEASLYAVRPRTCFGGNWKRIGCRDHAAGVLTVIVGPGPQRPNTSIPWGSNGLFVGPLASSPDQYATLNVGLSSGRVRR
jgi:hypothetical protein